jgi:hypothetical protein
MSTKTPFAWPWSPFARSNPKTQVRGSVHTEPSTCHLRAGTRQARLS